MTLIDRNSIKTRAAISFFVLVALSFALGDWSLFSVPLFGWALGKRIALEELYDE